jgi:hypothetical protein
MSIKKILIGIGVFVIVMITMLQINQPKVIIQNNKDVKNQEIKVTSLDYTCLSEMKNGFSEPYPCSFEDFESKKSKVEPTQTTEVEIDKVNERRNKIINDLKRSELLFKNLSIDEQYFQLKKPMLDLISDQSFVDYDNKRILFDKYNEIPRFENKKVDDRLNHVYTNYDYKYDPLSYNGIEPEPIQILNYRFFQYLKPIDIKRIISDTKMGLIDGFDFFWLENGNELKKIPLKKCGDGLCYYEEVYSKKYSMYSMFILCDDVCRGSMSYNGDRLFFNIDENGRLFLYNELNKDGGFRPEMKDSYNRF